MTFNGIATAALERALADVGTAARRVSLAASPAVEPELSSTIGQAPGPGVQPEPRPDLATEIVRLLRAQRHFEVAVKIARTADETTQTTLKLLR